LNRDRRIQVRKIEGRINLMTRWGYRKFTCIQLSFW